jgi:hypothetical protein
MPKRGNQDGKLANTGLRQSGDLLHRSDHSGLREVLNQVEVFLLGADEVLAMPALADSTVLRGRIEELLRQVHGLYKVYNL